jgi:PPOX class probable F420-dependent enzyme
VDRPRAAALATAARVARLATRTPTGQSDLVPITFALDGDRLVTAVDHKPKTTTRLKRLDNIRTNPEVDILIDHYDDETWDELWWVRLRGVAQVVEDGPLFADAVTALVAKYPQYREVTPAGPVIFIEILRWQWWSADTAVAPD